MSEIDSMDLLEECINASAVMTDKLSTLFDLINKEQNSSWVPQTLYQLANSTGVNSTHRSSMNSSWAPQNNHPSSNSTTLNTTHRSSKSNWKPQNIHNSSSSTIPNTTNRSSNLPSYHSRGTPIDSLSLNSSAKRTSKLFKNNSNLNTSSTTKHKSFNSTHENSCTSSEPNDNKLLTSNMESENLSQSISELEKTTDLVTDIQHITHSIHQILIQYPWINNELNRLDQSKEITYRFLKFFQYCIHHSKRLHTLYEDGIPRYVQPISQNNVMMNALVTILSDNLYWMKPLIGRLGAIEEYVMKWYVYNN